MKIIKKIFPKNFYSIEKYRESKRVIIIKKELEKIYGKEKSISKKKVYNSNKKNIHEHEILLEKTTNKYDKNIKNIKKLYNNLISLGLIKTGLKKYNNETENQKKKRIIKIKKIHYKLIKKLEYNKQLEKEIEIIHKKLNKNIESERNKKETNL